MQDSLFAESTLPNLLPYDGTAVLHPGAIPDADALYQRLERDIPWREHRVFVFGRWVNQPRLTAWFGDPHHPYRYSGSSLSPEPWTDDLLRVRRICEELSGTTYNSVLANLYRTGHDSIAWHSDDESELGIDPSIASVNLGQERRFDLRHRHTGETVKVPLPHASVLVMSGATQHHWLHQVPRTAKPMRPRINLTYRMIHA